MAVDVSVLVQFRANSIICHLSFFPPVPPETHWLEACRQCQRGKKEPLLVKKGKIFDLHF